MKLSALLFVGIGIVIMIAGKIYGLTVYMQLACLALLLLTLGIINRQDKKIHVPLMISGIVLDLALVLILQFSRNAVKTAASFSLTSFQQIHILFSLLAVLLYIPTFIFGLKRLKGQGDAKTRLLHIRSGVTAYLFRWVGFVFMFSFMGHE